jgi:hypothetical protein
MFCGFAGRAILNCTVLLVRLLKGETMRRLLLIPLMWAGMTAPSLGYYYDGNALYDMCRSTDSSIGYMERARCLGYILGVSDTLDSARDNNRLSACVPPGVQAGQLNDIVLMYLRNNPALRSMEANLLVVMAIGDAFGCAAKK